VASAGFPGRVFIYEGYIERMTDFLKIESLNKNFGGVQALAGFSCSAHEGEILGLIGPNGAGKTTLFNVISGFIKPDSGKVLYKGKNVTRSAPHRIAYIGIARTFQILRLIHQLSVLDNVMLSFKNQPGEHLGNLFFRPLYCTKVESENRKTALSLLEYAGLLDKIGDPAEALSYGQQKLLSLVCCLAAGADLLLLDEPVAGIAPEMLEKILAIIRELPSKGKTIIIIEHNIDVIMRICNRVIFMDAGEKVSEGKPEEVRNDPRVIEAYID